MIRVFRRRKTDDVIPPTHDPAALWATEEEATEEFRNNAPCWTWIEPDMKYDARMVGPIQWTD